MEMLGQALPMSRDLLLLDSETIAAAQIDVELLDARRFVCLLAGDFTGVSCESLVEFARSCILAGAVYFCTWGPDCSRAHDCLDLARDPEETDATLIPTSWHDHDALHEALHYAIFTALPSEAFSSDRLAVVAVVLKNSSWSNEVGGWMREPQELQTRVLSELKDGSV